MKLSATKQIDRPVIEGDAFGFTIIIEGLDASDVIEMQYVIAHSHTVIERPVVTGTTQRIIKSFRYIKGVIYEGVTPIQSDVFDNHLHAFDVKIINLTKGIEVEATVPFFISKDDRESEHRTYPVSFTTFNEIKSDDLNSRFGDTAREVAVYPIEYIIVAGKIRFDGGVVIDHRGIRYNLNGALTNRIALLPVGKKYCRCSIVYEKKHNKRTSAFDIEVYGIDNLSEPLGKTKGHVFEILTLEKQGSNWLPVYELPNLLMFTKEQKERFEEQIGTLEEKVSSIEDAVESNADGFYEMLEEFDQQLKDLSDNTSSKQEELQAQLDALDLKVSDHDATLSDITESVGEEITKLKESDKALSDQLVSLENEMSNEIDALKEKDNELSEQHNSLSKRIEDETSRLDERIDQINGSAGDASDRMQEEINEMKEELTDLSKKITDETTGLNERIDDVEDGIEEKFNALLNQVEETAKTTKSLYDDVAKVYTKVQYYRRDNTLHAETRLTEKNDDGKYTLLTLDEFEADGATIKGTTRWSLTHSGNLGVVSSERIY